MNLEMDTRQYLDLFLDETEHNLQRLKNFLAVLSRNVSDAAALNEVFRAAHTIKGMAAAMGFARMTSLTHALEDSLDNARKGTVCLSEYDLVQIGIDVNKLEKMMNSIRVTGADEIQPDQDTVLPAQIVSGDYNLSVQTVRIESEDLLRMIELVGELMSGHARLERRVRREGLIDLQPLLLRCKRVSSEIKTLAASLRMVPISYIFNRFYKIVHDMSLSLGKDIGLIIEGEVIEIDRTMAEKIGEIVLHLVRNAVDHGIEFPSARASKGKAARAFVRIAASRYPEGVVVNVEDDGEGINPLKIRAKAIKDGFLTEQRAARLSDEEIFQVIFVPGFSMAPVITDISGRGVGMDVVKSKVEEMSGELRITTAVDRGTSVEVKLPLLMTTRNVFLVNVGDESYAFPIENVAATVTVDGTKLRQRDSELFFLWNGRETKVSYLAELVGLSLPKTGRDKYNIVVLNDAEERKGVIVDSFAGRREVTEKPLSPFLRDLDGISGAALLNDGSVVLIVDAVSIIGGR